MARDANGIYSHPPNIEGEPGELIESAKYNAMLADVGNALNDIRVNILTDVTAFAKSILDDADAQAGRNTLGLPTATAAEMLAGVETALRAMSPALVRQSAARLSVPLGTVMHVAHSDPAKLEGEWLPAHGQAIDRTTYADLFDLIGETYGNGNGTTTFNLPDLRGEFVRGWDSGKGTDTGRAIGSAQSDQMEQHGHSFSDTATTSSDSHNHTFSGTTNSDTHSHQYQNHNLVSRASSGGGATYATNEKNDTTASDTHSHSFSGTTNSDSHSHTVNISGTTGDAGGTENSNENRPRNIALMAVIKVL